MNNTLRYLSILPGSILAYIAVYVIVIFIERFIVNSNGILSEIFANITSAAAYISIGVMIAPNHKKIVAIILGVVFTIFITISTIYTLSMDTLNGIKLMPYLLCMGLSLIACWCVVYSVKENDFE